MIKLTEEDIKYRLITPAIEEAGWKKEQILMEYFFTDGQVLVRGNTVKRGKRKKADYLLTYFYKRWVGYDESYSGTTKSKCRIY